METPAMRAGLVCAVLWLAACGAGEVGQQAVARHLILVSIDALGAKHVGAYGHGADTTPNLDALAREGALFERAYTQQLWTLTSHLTMLTGLAPQVHGAGHERAARPRVVTLARRLSMAKFATAAFVGASGFMDPHFGLGRGFDVYVGREEFEPLDNRAAFAWLRQQAARSREDPEHRFFLFLHYYDVHSDVDTPVPYASPYAARFMPAGVSWNHPGDTLALGRLKRSGAVTEEDRRALHALYDGGVYFVDEEAVGALLRVLREEGLAGDTLLAVTSDHGDELFEHASISHQQPYDEGARVPLVLRGPGVPAGLRVPHLAGLIDLSPTLLALLGLPVPEHVQGRDLSPLLRGGDPVRDAVFVDGIMNGFRHYRSAAVVDGGDGLYAWVGRVDAEPGEPLRRFAHAGGAELYELRSDPEQRRDLAAEKPVMAQQIERRILEWYAEGERRSAGLGQAERREILSEDRKELLRALGYGE